MSRRHPEDEPRTSRIGIVIAATALLSVLATVVAVAALVVATRSPEPSACATVAWKAIPDGSALPAGWSMVSNQVFVNALTTTIAGPTPSGSTQREAVYASLSCYGSDAGLALRRAHEGALAAGSTDVPFTTVGDESFAVSSAVASATTLDFRRGLLVADVTASTSVDKATLEAIARTVDAAMVRALAVSPDASALPQPSPVAAASAAPSVETSPSAPVAAPAASPSAAAQSHEVPDLEALLPHLVGSTSLVTQSVLGSTALGSSTASQALVASLQKLGKKPADLQIAGAYDPTGTLDLQIFAYRLGGVDTTELGRAVIESQLTNTAAEAASSQVTVGGHALTKLSYVQGSPVYFYLTTSVVYAIQSSDETLVTTVLGLLK